MRNAIAAAAVLLACSASTSAAQHLESIYKGRLATPVRAPVQTVMRTYEDAHVTEIYERLPRWVHKKLAHVDFQDSLVLIVTGRRRVEIVAEWISSVGDTVPERVRGRQKVLRVPYAAGEAVGSVDHVHLVRMSRYTTLGRGGYGDFRVEFDDVLEVGSQLAGVLRPGREGAVVDAPLFHEVPVPNVDQVLLAELGASQPGGARARVEGRLTMHDAPRRRIIAERITILDEPGSTLREARPGVFEGLLHNRNLVDDSGRQTEVVGAAHLDRAALDSLTGRRVQVRGWHISRTTRPGHDHPVIVVDAIRAMPGSPRSEGLTGAVRSTR